MTNQERMKAALEKSGIAFKTIKVYGRQIVVTCRSRDAAERWAALLGRFATVRAIVQSTEENKDQDAWFRDHPGMVRASATHSVWLVGATV